MEGFDLIGINKIWRDPSPLPESTPDRYVLSVEYNDGDGEGEGENDGVDHFDRIHDSLLLIVFNKIGDVKALGRCCVVSKRFYNLVPQVDHVVVKVDCVLNDDDSVLNGKVGGNDKQIISGFISEIVKMVLKGISRPLYFIREYLGPICTKRSGLLMRLIDYRFSYDNYERLELGGGGGGGDGDGDIDGGGGGGGEASVTHHSPTQVLKNFNEIKTLRIELPTGELELGSGDATLLKWRAEYGSTLDNCVILGASSVVDAPPVKAVEVQENGSGGLGVGGGVEDNGIIPESFYTNGALKLRVVWTISSLIAASARHFLLQPIIAEHNTLDSLELTDGSGQGVLCMNKDQLDDLRLNPLAASTTAKRTQVPALNMWLWYAAHLELPNGVVLKGATLVAIRPSEQASSAKKEIADGSWASTAFEEPYGTAAKLLIKRRTYCLEMNSF